MSKASVELALDEAEAARSRLRELLPPGSTVYCVLRHVSRSGMSRAISFYAIVDGEPRWLSGYIARALIYEEDGKPLYPMSKRHESSNVVGGCGMDMGFAVVYDLSYALHGDGYAIKHSWM
jgi:hypothetical protein